MWHLLLCFGAPHKLIYHFVFKLSRVHEDCRSKMGNIFGKTKKQTRVTEQDKAVLVRYLHFASHLDLNTVALPKHRYDKMQLCQLASESTANCDFAATEESARQAEAVSEEDSGTAGQGSGSC